MKRERTADGDGEIKTLRDWVDQSYGYSRCLFGRLVFSFSFLASRLHILISTVVDKRKLQILYNTKRYRRHL